MAHSRRSLTGSVPQAHRRSSKRSRKGCPECRRRKIKCDESQPSCGQCQKGGRKCRLLDSVFKQHAFTLEPNDRPGVGQTINEGTPTDDDRPTPADFNELPHETASLGGDEYSTLLIDSRETVAENQLVAHYTSNESNGDRGERRRNVVEAGTPRNLSQIEFRNHSPEDTFIDSLKDTQEELFLLRHYSEYIAPWMDLLYRYEVFSRETLTLAREHPILRYAACALAAKQLGQMRRPVLDIIQGKTQRSIALRFTAPDCLGFLWYGAKYYERAIQTLVRSITSTGSHSTHNLHNHVSSPVSLSHGDLMVQADGEDPIVRLLGTCILIQYEHMSASGSAWAGHLTGFAKLLDLINNGELFQPNTTFSQVYPFTKDIMQLKAGFWNFVVNDLEESFVSQRPTRIDTENLSLWRNMGLVIEDDGSLNVNFSTNSLSAAPEHARDKILSYTLIRLVCKLINYLAPILNPSPGIAGGGHSNTEYIYLENRFDSWNNVLSPSFHPDGSFVSNEHGASKLLGRELWFSNDLCATTMMYFHMARMLLLIHRPAPFLFDSSASPIGNQTPFDLLSSYRIVERQLQLHASKVIAIFQGTLCDAVKLRAIQPLYVAGRCCTDLADRRCLIEMFRDIQDSLGIATEYRVKALLQEWDTSYEATGIEPEVVPLVVVG